MAPKARGESLGRTAAKAKAAPAQAKPKAAAPGATAAKAKPKAKAGAAAKAKAAAAPLVEEVEAPAPAAPAEEPKPAEPEPAAPEPEPVQELPAAAPVEPSPPPVAEEPPLAERVAQLKETVPDPWASIADEAALAKIGEEAWDVLELSSFEGDNEVGEAPALILAKALDKSSLSTSSGMQRVAVSLDFSENSLTKVDSLPALWIRHLLLGSNPLESLDGLSELFPQLLSLDLSFVDISCISGGWEALAACQRLRSLAAEGASVCTFEDMVLMPQLTSLELVENDVEEVKEIAVLASKCPSLLRLDLRENPVASEPGYAAAIKKRFPKLEWHNNQSLKKYTAKGHEAGCAVVKDAFAVDGLYKNESCSCLEGNPCLDPITCVDWEHREAVAAEARKRKGLRDDTGKRL